nr:MAG TPA: resistance protein [Caudoviricetes sp.]
MDKELSLYEITGAFPKLMAQEEMSEEDKNKVEEELTTLLQKKSNAVIAYSKNIELTIKAMKEEESRISTNRKALENRLEQFKKYVKECMEGNGINKIETDLGTLSIAKSPISVEIVNEEEIPDEYKEVIFTTKVDKKKIADAFKSTGELVEGVEIHTDNTNLRIK